MHDFVVTAALRSRCGHYIFVLWFLFSFFFYSSPNLSGRQLDVYHTFYTWCGSSAKLECSLKCAARGLLEMQDPENCQKFAI